MPSSIWSRKLFPCRHIAQFGKTDCDCKTLLVLNAFIEKMLIEPEKLKEEEAVAKRAFAKLLNASGGVDVARMSFDAAHAEHENMNEATGDEDAKKLEVPVQEAQAGLTTISMA